MFTRSLTPCRVGPTMLPGSTVIHELGDHCVVSQVRMFSRYTLPPRPSFGLMTTGPYQLGEGFPPLAALRTSC